MFPSIRIFPLVDTESAWYPKNAFQAFSKYSSCRFVDMPEDADIVWIFSYYTNLNPIVKPLLGRRIPRLLRRLGITNPSRHEKLKDKLVFGSVHHLVPASRPRWAPSIKAVDSLSDFVHFFSRVNIESNLKYFRSPILQLPYWIDLEQFRSPTAEERRAARYAMDIPEDRFVIGSFQRDTLADGVTPKFEKAPERFCDILEQLDREDLFVLLAGPRREYIEGRLQRAGIPYHSLGHMPGERMPMLYNAIDLYLVTSRMEGGPQAILECMATATPILTTPVGIADVLDQQVVLSETDAFVRALGNPYPDVLNAHLERVREFDVRTIVGHYERVFGRLLAAHRNRSSSLPSETPDLAWFNVA